MGLKAKPHLTNIFPQKLQSYIRNIYKLLRVLGLLQQGLALRVEAIHLFQSAVTCLQDEVAELGDLQLHLRRQGNRTFRFSTKNTTLLPSSGLPDLSHVLWGNMLLKFSSLYAKDVNFLLVLNALPLVIKRYNWLEQKQLRSQGLEENQGGRRSAITGFNSKCFLSLI